MKDQTMNGTAVFKNLDCDALTITNFNVNGLVNKLNITEIFEDVATVDTTFKIFSPKTFKSATIENLKVKNNYEIMNQFKSLRNYHIKLRGDIDFSKEITVKNIRFNDKCNGVAKSSFIPKDGNKNTTYVIHGDQEFNNVTVHGKVFVDSNFINDINLTEFERHTIKIDEPFDFETVTFNEVVVNGSGIELDGHVDHLDLDNIFQNDIDDFQSILDQKVFEDIVFIDGNVKFEDTLNGFNILDICDLISDAGLKNLIIEGNSTFAKGPNVFQFNGEDVENLKNNLWYTDEPATLNGGSNNFNTITFKDNLTVLGKVNGYDLTQIESEYFSKTKNQTVLAEMVFTDEVLFMENISAPKARLGREVNGINIEKFKGDVLLNIEQVFEDTVYLETCRITNLQGEYKVNSLDFKTDVMRYDQKNMVSGHKKFKNLDVDDLIVTNNINVQEVDILQWIKNGVLSRGTFKITGNKQFQNTTFQQGISLKGLMNGMPFNEDAVMLKNLPQEISGRKTFTADEGVSFKALKVMGFVNGMDVAEIAHNQVFRSGENVFKSEIHFHGNMTTKNLVFNDLYQGVNVTQLLINISRLSALNNFEENYKELQKMSVEVENSLMGQAYFLHYYKSVAYIPFALRAFGRKNHKGECEIMVLTYEDGFGILRFFQWNEELNSFEARTGYSVSLGHFPSYIDQIHLGEKDYIYIEHEVDPLQNEGCRFLGKLTHFTALENTTELDNRFMQTNGTIFTSSFELPIYSQYCLLLVGYDEEVHIICINSNGELYLLQRIIEKSHQASVINIEGTLYLVTIKSDTPNEGPRTNIWKFNHITSQFELQQTIYEGDPISLTTVSYNSAHYVAVAYRHVQNTMHFGHVVIRRFDKAMQEFIVWQNIYLGTPTQVDFCVLPSNELVLYILTENPTEPLIVYIYEGISGFSKKIVGSAIPSAINTNQFSINNKHFVITQHSDHMNIIQAIFKGEKLK